MKRKEKNSNLLLSLRKRLPTLPITHRLSRMFYNRRVLELIPYLSMKETFGMNGKPVRKQYCTERVTIFLFIYERLER